jgi:hypothetical protein
VRKLLFAALAITLVVGFGTTAFGAAGDIAPPAFSDIAGHQAEAELTLMGALGVFTGESGLGGAVRPDDPLTRAQFCKVVVLATGRGATAQGLMGLKPTFTDTVPTWAWGYVNCAYYMGVVSGNPDGTFRADSPVVYSEAIAMLIRSVPGHKAQVPPGAWPYNYFFYGVDEGFTGDLETIYPGLPCTRGDMARMLFATMQVHPVDEHGEPVVGAPILENDHRLFRGLLTGYSKTAATVTLDGGGSAGHVLSLANPVHLVGARAYEELLGMNVLAVLDRDDKTVFIQKVTGNVVTGVFKTLDHDTAGNTWLDLADGRHVPYHDPVRVVLNNWDDDLDEVNLAAGDELIINTDENGLAVVTYALRWDLVTKFVPIDSGPYGVYEPAWDYAADFHKSTTSVNTKVTFPASSPFYYLDYDTHTWGLADGLTIDIPGAARVSINGHLAGRDDLAKHDVLKGATYGALGYDPGNPVHNGVIAISAKREMLQGTVLGTGITYPGPYYTVILSVGGVTRIYERDTAYVGAPTVGTIHKYGLDEKGNLFVDISFTEANPIVFVTGHRTESGSGYIHTYLMVDNRGVATSYEYNAADPPTGLGSLTSWVGKFAKLTVDGSSGRLVGIADRTPLIACEVKAIGAESCTIWDGGAYRFCPDPPLAVYKITGTDTSPVYTYIGLAGLAVDDEVLAYGSGSEWSVIVRDDRP